jgi:hypothetical protein
MFMAERRDFKFRAECEREKKAFFFALATAIKSSATVSTVPHATESLAANYLCSPTREMMIESCLTESARECRSAPSRSWSVEVCRSAADDSLLFSWQSEAKKLEICTKSLTDQRQHVDATDIPARPRMSA